MINICIIGFGSVGKILFSKLNNFEDINLTSIDKNKNDKNKFNILNTKTRETIELNNLKITSLENIKNSSFDYIFICTKLNDLEDILNCIKLYKIDAKYYITTQNGITAFSIVNTHFPNKTIGCSIYFGAYETINNIVYSPGKIIFSSNIDVDINNLTAFLDSKYCFYYPKSIESIQWTKFMFNAPLNLLGVIFNSTFSEFLLLPNIISFTKLAMLEIFNVAKNKNIKIDENKIDKFIFGASKSLQINSTLSDFRNLHVSELKYLIEPFLCIAKDNDIETPYIKTLFELCYALEYKNKINDKLINK